MEPTIKRVLSFETLMEGDRIEGDTIYLNSRGSFPKRVIFVGVDQRELFEYRLVKSSRGRLLLNK